MELLLTQKLLLDGLKLFRVSKGQCMVIMMLMDTEEKRWRLMEYLQNHLNASEEEIMTQARRITTA